MAFPKTLDELRAAGYRFDIGSRCRSAQCNAEIEWWITPLKRHIPLDVDAKGNVTPHHSTCKDLARFRK